MRSLSLPSAELDPFERNRWARREGDLDRVSRTDDATSDYDAHHASFAHDSAIRTLVRHLVKKARLELLDLLAWVAKSGDGYKRVGPESEHRARWQAEQIQAARGDVLSKVARGHDMTFAEELIVQFGVKQVHLPEIGLGGIDSDPGPVLHAGSEVRIASYTQTSDKDDLLRCGLAEGMCSVGVNRGHLG